MTSFCCRAVFEVVERLRKRMDKAAEPWPRRLGGCGTPSVPYGGSPAEDHLPFGRISTATGGA
ncbi:hypothetical protein MASR2M17_01050 [Aminivibrio sp.]